MKLGVAVVALLPSCALFSNQSAIDAAVNQANVAAYAAEELQCVQLANSRAEADACIEAVKARWCGPGAPLQKAGGCSLDGGK